jgi:hypothetical protein
MAPADGFERVVRAAARRPGRVLAVLALLCAASAALALGLQSSAATSTLAGRSSDSYQATERYRERFGDHAIVVLVRGPLQQLVLTENLGRLLKLEGCLSGNKPGGPGGDGRRGSPCGELARTRPVQVVYGPGTFINSAVGEIQDQLKARLDAKSAEAEKAAAAARSLARRQGRPRPSRRSSPSRPSSSSTRSSCATCCAQPEVRAGRRADAPARRPRLRRDARLRPEARRHDAQGALRVPVPASDAAAIQVRLKPGLSDAERERATALVRAAVRMPAFELADAQGYTVTGVPVLADDLSDALTGSIARLLVIAVLVMAGVLALVFRRGCGSCRWPSRSRRSR